MPRAGRHVTPMPANIAQKVKLPAKPHDVYAAMMDSRKHTDFTASPAKISKKVGGEFSAYDGYIAGRNLELVPSRRIVQSWRADDWPEGCFSIVTMWFDAEGSQTLVRFTQTGVPNAHKRDIAKGWKDHYWRPLHEWLTEH